MGRLKRRCRAQIGTSSNEFVHAEAPLFSHTLNRKLVSEFLGTLLLVATVVGSGIMAGRLAGGNMAIALLGNTIPTGAILIVIILMFQNISGAHFNPAVTLGFLRKREISLSHAALYFGAQISGAIFGTLVAHGMFDVALVQASAMARTGPTQWFAEVVAAFGLMATILMIRARKPDLVAYGVGLYITAAYWFTASTSFANPAVTIGRTLTNSFSGIRPVDAPLFIAAQFVGALIAVYVCDWLLKVDRPNEELPPNY